ncbi:MAG: acyl-CoA dehydratase activase-related protein, partial [Candidatus Heimdallarchaeaceae archaeon]
LKGFTCKACENYCYIERYEVGGRKFPFGGRCTRYEHLWKRSEKIEEKEKTKKGVIGIPKALLTHSFNPLFSTFFEELGYEVLLSEIDEEKELLVNAPFCYPVQILHGAVRDLEKKGVDYVFLPHIHQAPKGDDWFESTFCPITQASPFYVATSIRNVKYLSPTLNFIEGYSSETALIESVVKTLNVSKKSAVKAYKKAVEAQEKVERKFLDLGNKVLKQLEETKEIGLVLVGRNYNAFPPETSQYVPKKLSTMGVTVIPFDFLEKNGSGSIPWYFGNYIKLAIDLVNKKENLFLLYISSFSCTIDSFIQNYVRTEMKTKPYLILELDAHSADAGIQTRLEAFLEVIKNSRKIKKKADKKIFQVSKVKRRKGKTVVITSNNEILNIKDPRVKLYFPSFAPYHTDVFERILTLYGYHVGHTTDVKLEYPVEGLRYCSGKECIPLPIVLGQIMHLVRNRKPGEVIGFFMLRGGSPCAVFSYFDYINQFIENNKLKDVFIFRFDYLTNYLGMKLIDVLKVGPKSILLGDLMTEIDNALQVVGEDGSLNLLHKYWQEFLEETTDISLYDKNVDELIDKIATIPRKMSPQPLPKVLISGDFFVRFSPFFLQELKDIYAKNNILVKSTDLYELVLYSTHYNGYLVAQLWRKEPDENSTFFRALFTSLWNKYSRMLLVGKFAIRLMHWVERKQRKRFEKTGLLFAGPNNLKEIFRLSKPWISPLIFGEAIPTVGKGLETLENSHFDSLVLTGPFNCLPYKVSQAILKPIYLEHNTPFLVFDVDISAVTPNVKRLIHANVEQIKRRHK